jgi:hypothetical protein
MYICAYSIAHMGIISIILDGARSKDRQYEQENEDKEEGVEQTVINDETREKWPRRQKS